MGKSVKQIIAISFVLMIIINVIMYFNTVNYIYIFGTELNMLYVQLGFLVLEAVLASMVYSKKSGLSICILLILVEILNVILILKSLVI